MKRLIGAMAVALAVGATQAGEWRGVAMVGAWHAERTYWCQGEETEYRSFTPGLGVGYDVNPDVMLSGGVWRTSHDQWTPFVLGDYRPLHWHGLSAGLFAGASGGYCGPNGWRTLPLAGGSVRYDHGNTSVHLLVIPHIKRGDSSVPTTIGAALSFRF